MVNIFENMEINNDFILKYWKIFLEYGSSVLICTYTRVVMACVRFTLMSRKRKRYERILR